MADPAVINASPLICACLLLFGCGGESASRVGLDDFEPFGALPYLTGTRDARLADELARIVEEGGTPEQLTPPDDDESLGAALLALFPEDRFHRLVARAEELMPPAEFRFDPVGLQHAIAFRRKHDAERLEARKALERSPRRLGIRLVGGFAADTSGIDAVRLCVRLEAFHAAERLDEGDLDGALDAVDRMLAFAARLGAEKHLDARLHAAYLRADAMAVMQAVVTHDAATRQHLQVLLETVQGQLQSWPDDAAAWIGERAIGLHTYEMVRDGALPALLTEEETEAFKREGDLRLIAAAAQRHADDDQHYYLETMRRVIRACEKPYHTRRPLFESIEDDLQQRWGSPEYPLVAGRLLLKDLAPAQALQARDRANVEAWALALAAATGRTVPQPINPLTGTRYDVARDGGLVVISGIGAGRDADRLRVYVPDFTQP